jgi:hypothetical protein
MEEKSDTRIKMNDYQLWGRVVTAREELDILKKCVEWEKEEYIERLQNLIEDLVAEIDYLEDEVDTLGEYVFS